MNTRVVCHWMLTVMVLVASFSITGVPPTQAATTFQRGIVYASWWHGEYASADSDKMLSDTIRPLGVNWITILVTCYQDTIASLDINCLTDSKTPTDDDIRHVVRQAHSLGMKVMLRPQIDLTSDPNHWRGNIGSVYSLANRRRWFDRYTAFISHYATLAQEVGIDYLTIGTTLTYLSRFADPWRAVIAAVRKVYQGPLTYAANHDYEEFNITWWDALDAIGVDAFYSITPLFNPTVAQLKAAWIAKVNRLEQLSKRWKLPIIFTGIGYQSRRGANRTPWYVSDKQVVDLDEQANCYQAVFEAFKGKAWWQGVYWWAWTIHAAAGGPDDGDFTPQRKPAADVLRANYSQ
ncbi:MAG: hypothetical protein IT324_26155 [Anaerolineae bacterium]|nr:hypothetical protein [Anaerolineae bacterium]